MPRNESYGSWYRLQATLEGTGIDYVLVGTPDAHRIVAAFEHVTWTPETARAYAALIAAAPGLLDALRRAEQLLDAILGDIGGDDDVTYLRRRIRNAIEATQ